MPIHAYACMPTWILVSSFICKFIHSFIHSFIYSFIHIFIYLFIYSFIPSFILFYFFYLIFWSNLIFILFTSGMSDEYCTVGDDGYVRLWSVSHRLQTLCLDMKATARWRIITPLIFEMAIDILWWFGNCVDDSDESALIMNICVISIVVIFIIVAWKNCFIMCFRHKIIIVSVRRH